MTRKDFELIAHTLLTSASAVRPITVAEKAAEAQYNHTCHLFADRLALVNPRFDRARFLAACGVTS